MSTTTDLSAERAILRWAADRWRREAVGVNEWPTEVELRRWADELEQVPEPHHGGRMSTAGLPTTPAEGPRSAVTGLIESLETLAYDRGMDPTDSDPETCAWLSLPAVLGVIRRWAAVPPEQPAVPDA